MIYEISAEQTKLQDTVCFVVHLRRKVQFPGEIE
jgi:hypothetical protein